jgi:hypothetical protein
MLSLDRTVAGESRTFYVYTKDEADDQQIDYIDWRYAREGLWALTDDGDVGECLKVQKYPRENRDRVAYFMTFSFCRKWLTRKKSDASIVGNPELEAQEFLEKGAYYMSSPKSWIEAEVDKTRTKRAISLYATLFIAQDGHLTDSDWNLIGQAYRPFVENPRATVKRLFKKDMIQDMASNKVANLLENAGVTRKSVVENMEKLRQKATADGSFNTAYRVLEKQMEMLGMDEDLAAILPEGGDGASQGLEDADYEVLEGIEDTLDEEDGREEKAAQPPENPPEVAVPEDPE